MAHNMACVQQDSHADDPDRGIQVDSAHVLLAAWRSAAEVTLCHTV